MPAVAHAVAADGSQKCGHVLAPRERQAPSFTPNAPALMMDGEGSLGAWS